MHTSDATDPTAAVIAEILSGQGMTLADAARLCPASRGKGKVSPTTLLRWITEGAPRFDGTKVRLFAVRYGNRWMVSRGSLARFLQALTPTPTEYHPPATAAATPNHKRVKAADAKLAKAGVV